MVFGRGPDVDLTLWHKRGLIKAPEKKIIGKVDSSGYLDITSISDDAEDTTQTQTQSPLVSQNSQTTTTAQETVSNPFAFMELQASQTTSTQTNYFDTPTQTSSSSNMTGSSDLSSLKIGMENLEYQLQNLMEKVQQIESKMNSFEYRNNN